MRRYLSAGAVLVFGFVLWGCAASTPPIRVDARPHDLSVLVELQAERARIAFAKS